MLEISQLEIVSPKTNKQKLLFWFMFWQMMMNGVTFHGTRLKNSALILTYFCRSCQNSKSSFQMFIESAYIV